MGRSAISGIERACTTIAFMDPNLCAIEGARKKKCMARKHTIELRVPIGPDSTPKFKLK